MSEQTPLQDDCDSDEAQESVADGGAQFTLSSASCAPAREKPLPPWQERFCAEMAISGNLNAAAAAAGFSVRGCKRWRAEDPEFAAAWDEARGTLMHKVEEVGTKAAVDGDPRLIEFFLKSRMRETYGDKLGIEVTGTFAHLHLQPDQLAAAAANALPWIQEARAKHLKGPKPGEP